MPPSFSRPAYLSHAPVLFKPDRTWSKGPYRYFLDTRKRICKQVPIDLELRLTTEPRFFKLEPQALQQVEQDSAAAERHLAAGRLRSAYRRLHHRAGRYRVAAQLSLAVMLTAVGVTLYPWVPEVQYRLQAAVTPPAVQEPVAQSFTAPAPTNQYRLVIPKIGVDTAIVNGADLSILDREEGVWSQKGEPGQGNHVLAGHRFQYLPPNTTTLYNLDKLEVGDIAMVDHDGARRTYQVQSKRVVPASEVAVLKPTQHHQLTIYTCNDVRETERIVVVATPIAAR